MAAGLGLAHTCAAAAVTLAHMPTGFKLISVAAILVGFLDACCRHVLRVYPAAVVRLSWAHPGEPWRLGTRSGRVYRADLRGDTWVHPGLIVLSFDRRPRGRITVVLAADSLDGRLLRRLRVRLRNRRLVARGGPAPS